MASQNQSLSLWRAGARSARAFAGLAFGRKLRRRRNRLRERYAIDQGGTYEIFRETESLQISDEPACALVVGFRLKVLRSLAAPHWIFQRLCILTTPFWSGFRGFRTKLWMVDQDSKNYLGIYDWRGAKNAQTYVDALVRVLNPLSTSASVWYRIYPDEALDDFLKSRRR
jgi:hypothetical protein